MSDFWSSTTMRTLLLVTVFLALATAAADMLLVQPGFAGFETLNARRLGLMQDVDHLLEREQEGRELARLLKLESIEGLDGADAQDPVVFLGDCLDAAQLARLELNTESTESAGVLRRTRMTLRAKGRYEDIVTFVKLLESGSRVVTIDKVQIAQVPQTLDLEARLGLSIYDPRGGA